MAGIANPPGFGNNRWGEVHWAELNSFIHVPFLVGGPNHWQPSINLSQDRTISIAAGSGWCSGVFDKTDSVENISLPANTGSTDRFDFIVATFDWSAHTRTFRYISGTNSYPVVNPTNVINPTQVNRIPGAQYDGIIAITRTPPGRGVYQPADLWADVRPWGGAGGMISTRTNANVAVIDAPVGAMALSMALNKEWLKTESGWTTVDSDWVNLTPTSGSGLGGLSGVPVKIRKIGKLVELRGAYEGPISPGEQMTTVPVGMRPSQLLRRSTPAWGLQTRRISITSSGAVNGNEDGTETIGWQSVDTSWFVD